MSTALAPKQRVDKLRGLLDQMKPQLALALPKHMTPDRMARIALTACLKNPRLLECDHASFAGAMLQCAQLGLEPDGREAHLVPYRNNRRGVYEVQIIPDYKGLAKLARQSGQVKVFDWREVRQGDTFEYEYGSSARLVHKPSDAPAHERKGTEWVEARPVTHFYALSVLDSGESIFEVMRREDVEWHRDRYSRASGEGPWVTDFAAMGAKTCARKLSKKLPMSTVLMRAVDLDERAEAGLSQDLGAVFTAEAPDVAAENAALSKLDALTDKLETAAQMTPSHEPAKDPVTANLSDPSDSEGRPEGQDSGSAPAAPADPQPTLLDGPADQVNTRGASIERITALIAERAVTAKQLIKLTESACGVADYNLAETGDLVKLERELAKLPKPERKA